MKISALYELYGFVYAIFIGIAFGALYDFFRAVRYNTTKVGGLIDILFWINSIVLLGALWMRFLGGEIRCYMILGAILASALYFVTASRYVLRFFVWIIRKSCIFFNIILKILLTVRGFFGKIKVCIKTAFKFKKGRIRDYEKTNL